MSLIVTPRQLAQRAELYHQLSQLTGAGIGLPKALEIQRRSPPGRAFRAPLALLLGRLAEGATFAEAMRSTGRWMPSFDLALLEAGEKSGRLPDCFKLLSDYYTERSRLLRQVISDLGYPVFLVHFAILIGPFPELFLGNFTPGALAAYFAQTLGVLAPIYAVVFFLLYATQGRHGEDWRARVEQIVRRIPLCGAARRCLALSRLAAALEALLMAGVPVIQAWELAAAASGSPALRREVLRWRPAVEAGLPPSDAVSASAEFPELFASMYHTGEISGQLDDSLIHLRSLYHEEGTRKLRAFSEWTPKIVYFGVMLMVAYKVISFWSGYYGGMSNADNF